MNRNSFVGHDLLVILIYNTIGLDVQCEVLLLVKDEHSIFSSHIWGKFCNMGFFILLAWHDMSPKRDPQLEQAVKFFTGPKDLKITFKGNEGWGTHKSWWQQPHIATKGPSTYKRAYCSNSTIENKSRFNHHIHYNKHEASSSFCTNTKWMM